jgi:hypothetical protein
VASLRVNSEIYFILLKTRAGNSVRNASLGHNLSHIFLTPPRPSPRQYVLHIYTSTQVSWLTSGDAGCIADTSWHISCFTAVFQLLAIWPFLPILQDSGYAEEHDSFLWHGPSCSGVNSTEWKQDHVVCYSRQHGPDSVPVVIYEIQGVCYTAVVLFRVLRAADKSPYVSCFKLSLNLESLVKGTALWSVLLLSSLWQPSWLLTVWTLWKWSVQIFDVVYVVLF